MVLRCCRFPLDRNSTFVFIWDTLQCVAVHASYIFVWFQAAFDASISWHLAMIYILDFFYFAYILSQFVMSYKDKGKIVRDYKKITKQVLRTILLDILSLLPLEFSSVFWDNSVVVAAYFRLNRSIRYFRVYQYFSEYLPFKAIINILLNSCISSGWNVGRVIIITHYAHFSQLKVFSKIMAKIINKWVVTLDVVLMKQS